ncbi:MAG TPA: hypothetical protein VL547_10230 [Dinghuibacter sp.]|jgi:hypothetical protein|uniref:hypothetical protein n=1 Tax=Dinghuibacter sp. TaxID=2024697 RepID=UPI002CD8123C|nr:hypothetical protein [Dinghuibacter sp.]HTJ12393.1 hypothetical protein [Dinghuibacter sp.]
MSEMSTLTEVLNRLAERGIPELNYTQNGMTADDTRFYRPADLLIIKVYRFEGASDPSDMSIVYVFETTDDRYGYSLNAYGVYDDQGAAYDNFIREVREKNHGEQLLFEL